MEHRYHPRIAVQNRLLIHVAQSTFISGVTKNISNGGLALETVDPGCLNKNIVVRVALKVNGKLVIIPSQVVRVGKDEAALMFSEETSPRRQILKDWLDDTVRASANTFVPAVKQTRDVSVPPTNRGQLSPA